MDLAMHPAYDPVAASDNHHSDPTGSTPGLLDLPAETHVNIAEYLDSQDLVSLRRVCRKLEKNSNDTFAQRFFKRRIHLVSTHSLRVLCNITADRSFARHIQEIELVANTVDTCNQLLGPNSWYMQERAQPHKMRPHLFDKIAQNLIELSLSPKIKINAYSQELDGTWRDLYGLRSFRRMSDVVPCTYPFTIVDLHDTVRDFMCGIAGHSPFIRNLELGSDSAKSISLSVNMHQALVSPRYDSYGVEELPDDKYAKLPSVWAGITTLRLCLSDCSFSYYARSGKSLMPALMSAANLANLDFHLCHWDSRIHEFCDHLAHLKLRHLGIGGGEGDLQSIRRILASHEDTLESLSMSYVLFNGQRREFLELLCWMSKLRLSKLRFRDCETRDSWDGQFNFQNEEKQIAFALESSENRTVADVLKDAEQWASFVC